MICLLVIIHISLSTCDLVLSPAVFRIQSVGCLAEALIILICKAIMSIYTDISPSQYRLAQIKAEYISFASIAQGSSLRSFP